MNLSENQSKIINCLMKTGVALTYKEIMKLTELPRATITDNLFKLFKAGIIEKNKVKLNGLKGRPKTIWSLI